MSPIGAKRTFGHRLMADRCRYRFKTPKMPCHQFLANRPDEPQSPTECRIRAATEVVCEFIAD
jgi:hypothetical protein